MGKKLFLTKDISSFLQWKTMCCLRCYFFLPFSRHIFHTNCLLQMLPFFALFCLLSILCFVVKNDFRQKMHFRFFSEIQYAASDVTFFPFSPHVFHQNWLFFSRHMFPQNWLFLHVICSIKTGWFKCLVFGWFCCETMLSLLTKLANLFC